MSFGAGVMLKNDRRNIFCSFPSSVGMNNSKDANTLSIEKVLQAIFRAY